MTPPSSDRQRSGIRKRVSNACHRCRQQKIRCSGHQPCEQCTKRNLPCNFEGRAQKVLVSREFLDELERRAEGHGATEPSTLQPPLEDGGRQTHLEDADLESSVPLELPRQDTQGTSALAPGPLGPSNDRQSTSDSGRATPSAQLTNPFSSHAPRYLADSTGRPYYLGTSSNWAFTRRVLSMAYDKLAGQPAPTQSTWFDGTMYDLGWDGQRDHPISDEPLLPSSDYAIYLINAVKFHCGQMFHLFDEASFMLKFTDFHQTTPNADKPVGLWYVHFLILLAFGKVFVSRQNDGRRPRGAEYFVHAMKLMPDITFLYTQPVQAVEVLCCQALYLQCLDFRSAAYSVIGQALRIALAEGMHTNMQDVGLDQEYVQRCRNVWWTVYILDRQMSSLMGVPVGLRDDDISASLPAFSMPSQKSLALELNVKLSGILSQIMNSVYGTEGRLGRTFISSTRNALKAMAGVTDQLKKSFDLPASGSVSGISRLSAHLHLLHHQCVVVAIRPLLFSLLKRRLDKPTEVHDMISSSASTWALLQMCVESSQHIVAVLKRLKGQTLLESFLPFDLEAAFAAGMTSLLAPFVDRELLATPQPWLDMVHGILDELIRQGHLQAAARKAEMLQLQEILYPTPTPLGPNSSILDDRGPGGIAEPQNGSTVENPSQDTGLGASHFGYEFLDDAIWRTTFTADQLMTVADGLDLDGIEWMTTGSSN
ncbi:hypothetical protein RBB50_011818 [Rhinocladiella similis]